MSPSNTIGRHRQDPLEDDKMWAWEMARGTDRPEYDYWVGFRLALYGPDQDEVALLAWIDGSELTYDARGRGYRDGRAWVSDLEANGSVMAEARTARKARRRRPRKKQKN